uniref:Preproalbumin PawS1 n=1 Tax=Philactis zinnioides TaxID=183068 RepID=A0A023GYI1_PHIZI|nr:preproalbumin PawS1 [Philactis zinnioides]
MAKLVLIVLAMVAILAFVEVSGYTTSISTTTIEENGGRLCVPPGCFRLPDGLDNPREQQCDSSRIPFLSHCEMYLTSFDDYKLRMAVENPKQHHHLSLCCNQLQQVQEQCQCEAIEQVLGQAYYKQGGQGQMMERMVQKAKMLPNQCNLQCSI